MKHSISAVAAPVVLFGVLLSPTAEAHDQLVSSNPSPGTHLSKAPTDITLTFDNAPLDVGNEVVITAPGGQRQPVTPKRDGRSVVTPFSPAGSGTYRVVWRVVSSDGHPISGQFDFDLTGVGPTSSAGSGASAAPSASSGGASPAVSQGTQGRPARLDHGNDSGWWISGGVVAGVLASLVGLGLWVKSRRSRAGCEPREEEFDDE